MRILLADDQALLRGTWTVGVTLTATDSTMSVDPTSGLITFGSATQNFLTTAFKKGDVIRLAGLTGALLGLNQANLRCVGVTAHALTLAPNAAAVSKNTRAIDVPV